MFSIVHMARTFIGFASVTAAAAVGAAIVRARRDDDEPPGSQAHAHTDTVRALDAARDRLRATVAPRAAVDDAAA
jgi:hypothetical protein